MAAKDFRTSKSLFDGHRMKASSHEAAGQMSLAIRELREASRLRPRDQSTRSEIDRIQRILVPPKLIPDSIPSERLCSIFNLSIRYWDRNMPSAALKEVCHSGLTTTGILVPEGL